MKSRLSWVGLAAAVGALAIASGGVAWLVPPIRQALTTVTVTSAAPAPSGFSQPTPTDPVRPLLSALTRGPAPAPARVAGKLPAMPSGLAGRHALVVLDPVSGRILAGGGSRGLMPASTMKLLTSFAALDLMDPGVQFQTRVVSPAPGKLVLVGGGDPLLTTKQQSNPLRPSLALLADRTAESLAAQGVRSISLGYDSTLFAGPAWNPTWTPNYRYSVAPVSPLVVDKGAAHPGAIRSKNPARSATAAFRTLLRRRGIEVTGTLSAATAGGAPEVASIASLPLDQIIEETLQFSDNDAAEHLLRLVSLAAGRNGSSASGAAVVRERLQAHGLWTSGLRIADGSGLSRTNRVTPTVLAKVVGLGLTDTKFRALVSGLPVAGVTGTLRKRFDEHGELAGRGFVRAKTGTLRDVAALAGYVVTRDGSVLTFAALSNRVFRVVSTEHWLDRSIAALASCGCR